MGKISDALKKVTRERLRVLEEKKDEFFSRIEKHSGDIEKIEASLPNKYTEAPTLRDKFASVMQEVTYVAKPSDRTGVDPRIVTYHDYSSPISEQYRILRANLKSYMGNGKLQRNLQGRTNVSAPKILTVTSSLHNEGKTVTCVNLAIALAKDPDNKVLIVDADLRNGTVHKLLNLDQIPGLSEVLSTDYDYSVALHQTTIKNLFVIPRGATVTNSSEILGSKKMKLIIERLRSEPLTHIIVDTPPIVPFSDAAVLCPQSDASILVVQAYRTQSPTVARAKQVIEQSHGNFLGFVLTQSDHFTPDYYSYYYYYRARKATGDSVQ